MIEYDCHAHHQRIFGMKILYCKRKKHRDRGEFKIVKRAMAVSVSLQQLASEKERELQSLRQQHTQLLEQAIQGKYVW